MRIVPCARLSRYPLLSTSTLFPESGPDSSRAGKTKAGLPGRSGRHKVPASRLFGKFPKRAA